MLKHASNRQPRRFQVIAAGGKRYSNRAQAIRRAQQLADRTGHPVKIYDRHRRQYLLPALPVEAGR